MPAGVKEMYTEIGRTMGMSAVKDCIIFHITRPGGRAQLLHPLGTPKALLVSMQQGEIRGRYGAEPGIDTLRALRAELVRMAEIAARRARAEARFAPTFIISAVVFLVVYFLFSLLVPDPVPMIDEAALGILLAALTYFLLTRRDAGSEAAVRERQRMIQRVDRIVFTESAFVAKVEGALREYESAYREIADGPALRLHLEIEDGEMDEASCLLPLLESALGPRDILRIVRGAKRGVFGKGIIKGPAPDMPLVSLYLTLKEGVGERITPETALPLDSAGTPGRQQ